jgi:hypothetical protein
MKALRLWGLGVLATILICAVPAFAEQMWVHGTQGRIEYTDRITGPGNRTVFGFGLQFIQNSGSYNYIHYAVPTKYGPNPSSWGARYIYIDYYTGSADAGIYEVHIYNGGGFPPFKIVSFSPAKTGSGRLTIDLGTVTSFSGGLGVTIYVGAGVEAMDHTFKFMGVGADFSSPATISALGMLLLAD